MILSLVLLGLLTGTLAACGSSGSTTSGSGSTQVVASFFPLAEAAREAGGVNVTVRDLTPAGAEPHDLELTPRQVDAIETADLVVAMGDGFQPAVENLAGRRGDHALFVLDSLGISKDQAKDPHVWLDPVLMAKLFDLVRARLGSAVDTQRADTFAQQLRSLDGRFAAGLRNCARRTIVTAHEAFGYLVHRYGLTQDAIAGIDPEQEPNADRIAQLADLALNQHVTTIFTEDLVSPRVADTLAREAGGLKTVALDPLESSKEGAGGYVARMDTDLRALQDALGCAPAR
jgi:zinc transport system substrate-binding protein